MRLRRSFVFSLSSGRIEVIVLETLNDDFLKIQKGR
ncbi:unnamed protein product [Brassica rapa subsp. trilocularis]